ncbi:MAG TPA: MarR family transcriptional regulator [Acidimicrobiia bacterium]|nr:MarR family transcriptional regulator [Acidimicrobiia bacterium]
MTACREFTSAVDAVNQIVAGRMGVNRTDHRVLEILNRKGPMTAGDLATAGHLTTGAVTAVVDRLEEVGYVRRVRDTEDRRRVLVEQTVDGRKTGMRYYQPFMAATFEAMDKYTADELAVIRDFMQGATAISEQYVRELRAAGSSDEADTA